MAERRGNGRNMGFVNFIVELLHDPRMAIASWIAAGPLMAYGCVFLIVFIETGVVFFPFLPGDSLLFASGFFAQGGGFNIVALLATAWCAAILGDQCNFMIGHFFGRKIIESGKVKVMTPERIEKSEKFLEKWGHLAIFLGRFFPFIRTFVPFIAGMGGMHWRNFVVFNVLGGITWSTLFTLLGYFFGGIPFVQDHFELLIVGIILVSVVPTIVGLVKSRLANAASTWRSAERRAASGLRGECRYLGAVDGKLRSRWRLARRAMSPRAMSATTPDRRVSQQASPRQAAKRPSCSSERGSMLYAIMLVRPFAW